MKKKRKDILQENKIKRLEANVFKKTFWHIAHLFINQLSNPRYINSK